MFRAVMTDPERIRCQCRQEAEAGGSTCYGGVWFAAVSLRYRYGTKKEIGREVFACDGNVIFF
jgi:hypothetical protein